MTATRTGLLVAATAYLLLVARITLWPQNPDVELDGLLGWAVDTLGVLGVDGGTAYSVAEAAANVVMFVPYGLLLALIARPGRRWLAVVVPALASVTIEVLQLSLLPDRVATVQDVAMNTLGAVIGVGVVVLTESRARRSSSRSDTPR